MSKCDCEFCRDHGKYKWAVIMSCRCCCHDGDGTTGHSALCCSIPNGLKANNPFPELSNTELCKKIITEFHEKHPEDA